MEGFDLDGVTELLEHEGIIDSNQFAPSVMVALVIEKRILQNVSMNEVNLTLLYIELRYDL